VSVIKKGVTPHLVGWLWADLLLGLFVIFLAAAAAPAPEMIQRAASPVPRLTPMAQPSRTPAPTPTPRLVDAHPLDITIPIDARTLLSGDNDAVAREVARIAAAVDARMDAIASGRRVAVALVFASHEDPVEGDRLTRLGTAALRSAPFESTFVKSYPTRVQPGGTSTLTLELFFVQ
jgi:hypothetical protein